MTLAQVDRSDVQRGSAQGTIQSMTRSRSLQDAENVQQGFRRPIRTKVLFQIFLKHMKCVMMRCGEMPFPSTLSLIGL